MTCHDTPLRRTGSQAIAHLPTSHSTNLGNRQRESPIWPSTAPWTRLKNQQQSLGPSHSTRSTQNCGQESKPVAFGPKSAPALGHAVAYSRRRPAGDLRHRPALVTKIVTTAPGLARPSTTPWSRATSRSMRRASSKRSRACLSLDRALPRGHTAPIITRSCDARSPSCVRDSVLSDGDDTKEA
jgi:hypothetical protein